MADEMKKCAHENCSCMVGDKEKYCSESCEDSAGVTTLGCDCPHSHCSGHAI